MKKSLFVMLLLVAINASNAKMVADGVELISSKSWTTGTITNGHVEENIRH